MVLKAGTMRGTDFAGSMAEAMEKAFEVEWRAVKKSALPTAGQEDRRLLFIAIAQGVVRHLKENADSFKIKGVPPDETVEIQTAGVLD